MVTHRFGRLNKLSPIVMCDTSRGRSQLRRRQDGIPRALFVKAYTIAHDGIEDSMCCKRPNAISQWKAVSVASARQCKFLLPFTQVIPTFSLYHRISHEEQQHLFTFCRFAQQKLFVALWQYKASLAQLCRIEARSVATTYTFGEVARLKQVNGFPLGDVYEPKSYVNTFPLRFVCLQS